MLFGEMSGACRVPLQRPVNRNGKGDTDMSLRKSSKLMLGAFGAFASALFAGQALAQEQTGKPQAAQPSIEAPAAEQAAFSDEKLKSFAVAYLEVDKITKEYLPKLKEARDTEAQQKVREEAGAKMIKAVQESSGISVNEYNQIAQSAQTDPDLAKKITGYIQEAEK
jgi:hypothetical protein